ncbi:hypothetical protein EDB83DRAFT_1154764 [Lactarius deliciosus]|nr:hypothetical protein EDB83DRAFT_1154764 [Lactarius deliciosus]
MMAATSAALIAIALVWANTASMAVRALYAWRFAHRFCEFCAASHRQRETERALGPAALRARSVCGCHCLRALEHRCACGCPAVATGAALARCAGRWLSRRLCATSWSSAGSRGRSQF